MKKTLLGFGLLPLTILSVGVVASCSSTNEKDTPLEKEVAKFKVPIVTKDKTITATATATKINAAESSELKLVILNTIATIPPLSKGFTMVVNLASISTSDPKLMEVFITITETSSAKTKDVVLTIIDFPTRIDLLELQASMFATKKEGVNMIPKSTPHFWLNNSFNNLPSQVFKKITLISDVKDFPIWDELKYDILIGEGTVLDATSVQVPITISTIDSPILTKEVVMTITGFKSVFK